jgi:hypothetical protein
MTQTYKRGVPEVRILPDAMEIGEEEKLEASRACA